MRADSKVPSGVLLANKTVIFTLSVSSRNVPYLSLRPVKCQMCWTDPHNQRCFNSWPWMPAGSADTSSDCFDLAHRSSLLNLIVKDWPNWNHWQNILPRCFRHHLTGCNRRLANLKRSVCKNVPCQSHTAKIQRNMVAVYRQSNWCLLSLPLAS